MGNKNGDRKSELEELRKLATPRIIELSSDSLPLGFTFHKKHICIKSIPANQVIKYGAMADDILYKYDNEYSQVVANLPPNSDEQSRTDYQKISQLKIDALIEDIKKLFEIILVYEDNSVIEFDTLFSESDFKFLITMLLTARNKIYNLSAVENPFLMNLKD